MPRLLVGDRWYDAIRSQSWYEGDFEQVVIDRAQQLFPAWRCVIFRELVEGEDGSRKKPDLALIDHDYRSWWVVEVELAHHPLDSHVLPQVRAFRTGRYGRRHAEALGAGAADLDVDRLTAMMSGDPPQVLVIVDSPAASWRAPLREADVRLAIVEPFRDANNDLILRLNGEQPEPPAIALSRCTRFMRRLWKVHSPAALPGGIDEVLIIAYEDSPTKWNRTHLADAVMLTSRGDVLAGLDAVDLVRRDDGSLAFLPISPPRSRRQPS